MDYNELKTFCDEKIKSFPQYEKRYRKEIIIAERFYKNGRNLFQELNDKKNSVDNRYVIPFLLNITDTVDLDKKPEYVQVKSGASGGKIAMPPIPEMV